MRLFKLFETKTWTIFLFAIISAKLNAQQVQINYNQDKFSYFQSFDITQDGKRMVAVMGAPYATQYIIVYEIITGKEIARLPIVKGPVSKVEFDDHGNRIIVQQANGIHVFSSTNFSPLHTFSSAGANYGFNETTGKLVVLDAPNLRIVNLDDGNEQLVKVKSNITNKDLVQFSADGKYFFILNNGKITRVDSFNPEAIEKLKAEHIDDFIVGDGLLITKSISRKSSGSSVITQFFDLSGNELGPPTELKKAFSTGGRLSIFNKALMYSSFDKIDFVDKNGEEFTFDFPHQISDYLFSLNPGFVLNYGKQIDIVTAEGQLINRFYANASTHTGINFQNESNHLTLASGNTILFIRPNETAKAKTMTLNANFINTLDGDGEWLALASDDHQVRILNSSMQKEMLAIDTEGNTAKSIRISKDLNLLAGLFNEGSSIRVYDLTNGKLIQELEFSNENPTSMDLSENFLVVGSESGKYSTWEWKGKSYEQIKVLEIAFNSSVSSVKIYKQFAFLVSIGRLYRINLDGTAESDNHLMVGHNTYIHDMVIDRNGEFLISSAADGTTKVWEIEKGILHNTFSLDSGRIDQLVMYDSLSIFGTGPGLLSASYKNDLLYKQLLDPTPELIIQSSNTGGSRKLSFSPDGKLLATSDGNQVKVRDVQTGFMISEFVTKDNVVNDLEFNNTGQSIIVAAGRSIEMFDPFTGQSKKYIDLKLRGRSIHEIEAFPKLNLFLAINHHGWHEPLFIHQNSGQYLGSINVNPGAEIDKFILNVRISKDEKRMAIYGSHYIKIFEVDPQLRLQQVVAIKRTTPEISNEYWVDLLDFSPDGKLISYVEFERPNNTVVYDIEKRREILRQPGKLSKFNNEQNLLLMSSDEELELYNLSSKSNTVFHAESNHFKLIQSLAYNERFNLFASSDIWGNIKIWDSNSGQAIKEINRFDNDIYEAEISPNGEFIAYNSKRGIFLFRKGKFEIIDLDGTNYPYSGVFSPDNKYFYFRKGTEFHSINLLDFTQEYLFDTGIKLEESSGSTISPDGKYLLFQNKTTDEYLIFSIGTGAKIATVNRKMQGLTSFAKLGFSQISNSILLGIGIVKESDSLLSMAVVGYNFLNGKLTTKSKKSYQKIGDPNGWDQVNIRYNTQINDISPDEKWHVFLENYYLKVESLETGKILYTRYDLNLKSAIFTNDSKHLIIGKDDGEIQVMTVNDFEIKQSFRGTKGGIGRISVNKDNLMVLGEDDKISVFDIHNQYKKVYAAAFVGDGAFVIAVDEGYYYASKGASDFVAFKRGLDVFPFDQFDLFYNRPDIVMQKVDSSNTVLANAFEKAYKKRLSNIGFTEEVLSNDFKLPEIQIANMDKIPASVSVANMEIMLRGEDQKYAIDRFNIWVNGVPVNGVKGFSPDQKAKRTSKQLSITLSVGINKIQVSCYNVAGIESLRRKMEVNYTPPKTVKPDLYIVTLSISNYKDDRYDLTYARKDGQDMVNLLLEQSSNYNVIHLDTLFDERVTRENIQSIKSNLMKSRVDDQVIVFASGHGLLDKNFDFYFAGYDMNFENPAERGILYESIEGILDGIPARKKILMIDACHSGEVDKDGLMAKSKPDDQKLISGWKSKGAVAEVEDGGSGLGLSDSFELMQELFANLSRGSGAVVISAAAGDEYALEGDQWDNGVFTLCVREGLTPNDKGKKLADTNRDGRVSVSELKEFVYTGVVAKTKGKQKPTSRRENLTLDFFVY